MANTYAVTDFDGDTDPEWIALSAATRNVIMYLSQKRETATAAPLNTEERAVAVESAEGAAAEDE